MKESQWKLRWIRVGEEECADGQLPLLAQPYPPRDEDSDVTELASSVRLHGVLEPILLREVRGGLEIVSGHRRYRAAIAAGIDRIPAVVTTMGDAEAIRAYLSQKLVRRPLSVEAQDKALGILRQLRADEKVGRPSVTSGTSRLEADGANPPVDTSRHEAVLKLDRMNRAADTVPAPASQDAPWRRSAENLLRRVESIFNDVLVRRTLPAERVESVLDAIQQLEESAPDLDWRFLVTGEADPTASHSLLVAATCSRVARYLGYSEPEARELVAAGLLHDVGMVFVREAASRTPRSDVADHDFLKSHTRIGRAVIESTGAWSDEVANAARDHHERCNGNGYPAGKRGSELSTLARLLGIVDSYCTMVSPRPYRAALSPSVAWLRLGKSTEAGLYDERLFDQLAGLFWKSAPPEPPKKLARSFESTVEKAPDVATMPLERSR